MYFTFFLIILFYFYFGFFFSSYFTFIFYFLFLFFRFNLILFIYFLFKIFFIFLFYQMNKSTNPHISHHQPSTSRNRKPRGEKPPSAASPPANRSSLTVEYGRVAFSNLVARTEEGWSRGDEPQSPRAPAASRFPRR